ISHAKVVEHFGHRMNRRPADHPCRGIGETEPRRQIDKFAPATAKIEQRGVESAFTQQSDRAQDGLRVLLVTDTAREQDEKAIARQIEARAQRATFVLRDRAKARRVDPVIEPELTAPEVPRTDRAEIRTHSETSGRQPAVDREQAADSGFTRERLQPANLRALAPATKIFE